MEWQRADQKTRVIEGLCHNVLDLAALHCFAEFQLPNERTTFLSDPHYATDPKDLAELAGLAKALPDKGPDYRHKRTYLWLARQEPPSMDGCHLVQGVYDQICANWDRSRMVPSSENWRWEPKVNISPRNQSPEVTLERAIVQVGGPKWTNQVPTASGLSGSNRDKRRCLNLVHKTGPGAFEFIELKWDSGTPLYAAMEALSYGILCLFTRAHLDELYSKSASTPELLKASEIRLQVLAPASYYEHPGFAWFERILDRSISEFAKNLGLGVTMGFQYRAFRQGFLWPCEQAVLKLASKEIGPAFPSK